MPLLELSAAHTHPTLPNRHQGLTRVFRSDPMRYEFPLFHWLSFVNLIPTTVISEEGPLQWPVALSVEYFLEKWLTWKGSLPWAVPPKHIILSYIKGKLAEQAMGSKPVSSIPLWFLFPGFCLSSRPGFEASVIVCDPAILRWNKPFSPQVVFDHDIY